MQQNEEVGLKLSLRNYFLTKGLVNVWSRSRTAELVTDLDLAIFACLQLATVCYQKMWLQMTD